MSTFVVVVPNLKGLLLHAFSRFHMLKKRNKGEEEIIHGSGWLNKVFVGRMFEVVRFTNDF